MQKTFADPPPTFNVSVISLLFLTVIYALNLINKNIISITNWCIEIIPKLNSKILIGSSVNQFKREWLTPLVAVAEGKIENQS